MDGKLDIERLRAAMNVCGLDSVSALAVRAGIHRNSLMPYVSGAKSVYTSTFLAVCSALNTTPSALIAEPGLSDPYQVFPIVERLCRHFHEANAQLAFFLFGSRARGNARRFSDYDIGTTAMGQPLTIKLFLEIKEALLQSADDLPVKVDLLNFDQAPLWFLAEFDSSTQFLAGSHDSYNMLKGRIHGIKETIASERIAA